MSYSVAQIQAQNQRFQQARDEGKISQAEYERAMAIQNANMARAQQQQKN